MTTKANGEAVPSQCDAYSLYVQLSRCPLLEKPKCRTNSIVFKHEGEMADGESGEAEDL
jgi:hypothetical protein